LTIGKYYLVDAGYTNGPGFLSPFRSTRYHLKEWAALQKVEGLEDSDMLRAYEKLIVNERLFEALMALPDTLRKPWLMTLP
jgi:hypothetical protein